MFKTAIFVSLISLFVSAQLVLASSEFTDRDLDSILRSEDTQNTAGLIYAWSPRMPLSILGADEIAIIAKKLNLPLYIVVDPSATEQEIRNSVGNNSLLKNSAALRSEKLISMSMKIHYPSLVMYRNGNLLTPSRPGYDEPERLEAYIIRRLK